MYDAPQIFQWKGYLLEVQKGGNHKAHPLFGWDGGENLPGYHLSLTYVRSSA